MTEQRIVGGSSLFPKEQPELCPNGIHNHTRVVKCSGDYDIVECSRCGKQKRVRCNFDEEYS